MTFWNEPLRKFRYLVNFGGSQRVECKSVTLPQFQTDVAEYRLINHSIKYPGIGKWSDCNMKFIITKDLLQSTFLGVTGYANDFNFRCRRKHCPGMVSTQSVYKHYQLWRGRLSIR